MPFTYDRQNLNLSRTYFGINIRFIKLLFTCQIQKVTIIIAFVLTKKFFIAAAAKLPVQN